MFKILNEDCMKSITKFQNNSIDVVLTSPFYNTNKKAGNNRTLKNTNVKKGQYNYVRYDEFVDNMNNTEYVTFITNFFKKLYPKLKDEGCVLFNMNYGSENTECMWLTVAGIIQNTDFTIADDIIWKKTTALPNSCSSNKLTRIVEHIFVFCKKKSLKTFNCNKKVTSTRKTGQKMYENIFNLIEAKNNDGSNPLNKATYSTELCLKLLEMYAPKNPNTLIYDAFNGTGTTGVAALKLGLNYIGSEISEKQCEYSIKRLSKEEER